MSPSKENAVKALGLVERVLGQDDPMLEGGLSLDELEWLGDFLSAVAPRLPREATLERHARRKKGGVP